MKLLLVDDHALFRAGLRLLLGTLGRELTLLEAGTADDALAMAAAHEDLAVCLLDLSLKDSNGLGLLTRLKQAAPQCAVVVVSGADDAATIRACIDAGAMSFIPKSVEPAVLTQALQHVVSGAVYLPEHIQAGPRPAAPALTPRQSQVLQQLARGLPTKLIARELGLSEHTVKEHIALVFQALGVRNRTEAVIKASRLRMVDASGS